MEGAAEKELITMVELEAAAHKQGFATLDEVDRAVLDPGGSIAFLREEADAGITAARRAARSGSITFRRSWRRYGSGRD